MTEIQIVNDVSVELLHHAGTDASIIETARVSSGSSRAIDQQRFLNALMRHKHGSPFEHGYMQFHIKLPIFAAREFQRHRIGFSYNEMSGRYRVLDPVFYVPGPDRSLVNTGTSMKPVFEAGTDAQGAVMRTGQTDVFKFAWEEYEFQLSQGVAKEVARSVLPLAIQTEMYVSMNPRSLMAFLELRTSDAGTSYPQYEIELVAKQMEAEFAKLYPHTYAAFVQFGRQAP